LHYAIEVHDVTKNYRLYGSPADRLKEALHPLRKSYSTNFTALEDVTLQVPEGATWGIIGLNGSGKSTLLKIICGLLQPNAGHVRMHGRVAALLELGAGFNHELTGRDNVYFNAALIGLSHAEIKARYQDIVDFADIGDFIDQPVKTYSSGMLVRLAFAVAVNVSPDILVVDEALSVGDARFQHKCLAKIREFKDRCTVLFVSHDLGAVAALCDQVAWIHHGRVRALGEPKKVVAVYLQATCGNLEEQGRAKGDFRLNEDLESNGYASGVHSVTGFRVLGEQGESDSLWAGEQACIEMRVDCPEPVQGFIAGFYVRNKYGIILFGFNNEYIGKPVNLDAGKHTVRLTFRWPLLARAAYSLSIGIAERRDGEHVTHHWLEDVAILHALSQEAHDGMLSVDDRDVRVVEE
jgi:lipopolysaccharide transport system ATP-binding protein